MTIDIYSPKNKKEVKAFWLATSKQDIKTIDRCLKKSEGIILRGKEDKVEAVMLFGIEKKEIFVYFFGAKKRLRKSKKLLKFFRMLQRSFVGNSFVFFANSHKHKKAVALGNGFYRWQE